MKSLSNQEDIRSTKESAEQAPSWFLSIPDQKTPWYLVNLDYADGFVHWYDAGAGPRRVVCAGGVAGKGFDPTNCPICGYVLEQYQEAKRLEQEGDDAKAKQVRERANRMRGKQETHFKAIRGQRALIKTKTGKSWVADFDMADDESTAAVGVVSLSQAQFEGLVGMINGSGTEFISSGDDLGNRVLWTTKESRKGKQGGKYSAVVWSADSETSDMPDVEIPEELLDMDLANDFALEPDEVIGVYNLISGQELEDPEDDEEVETETDSAEEVTNADLDDLDDDEDPESDESDEDFKDDEPWDEEPPKGKVAPKAGVRKPDQSRKSGKQRL